MDAALKIASVLVGERNYLKSKNSILKRSDISNKKKLRLMKRLTRDHFIKVYRFLIKACKVLKIFFEMLGIMSFFFSILIIGAEGGNLGVNILLGILLLLVCYSSYKTHSFIDEHLAFYKRKLKYLLLCK